MDLKKYECWLAFREKIFPGQKRKCMEYFKSAENMFIASKDRIDQIPFLNAEQKEELIHSRTEEELDREERLLNKLGIRFEGISGKEYPQKLKEIPDAPLGLFYKGQLPKNGRKSVAIVGARYATGEGMYTAREAAKALAKAGIDIISGMATGIDGEAQDSAIHAGGKSYAVLGCAVDICYPKENRRLYVDLIEKGGVLSEYPPGTEPRPYRFPERNRLISGLADTVLVVEARKKSGSLITAGFALEQGRDVFAVPGRIHDQLSEGCNELIRQGAGVFCSAKSFLEDLGIEEFQEEKSKKNKLALAKSENMVYSCVDLRGKNIDELVEESSLSVSEVIKALTTLQVLGFVEKRAGFYRRKS